MNFSNYQDVPNDDGYFGEFGGRYIPENLMPLILEIDNTYKELRSKKNFQHSINYYLKQYVGRPSPLFFAERTSRYFGGARIYLKRDELNHTGSHKINNVLGQILLAKHMGKKRIIAETSSGQHGVATATICALFDLPCIIYMGESDIENQALNVVKMQLLGAKIITVSRGSKTLKDAVNEALIDWVSNLDTTYYVIGTVAGPHPFPAMVRDFQKVIGIEAKEQILEAENTLPDALIASIGLGSNAIGLFHAFLENETVAMYGVEAGGKGLIQGQHAAALATGKPGVLHGSYSYLLQNNTGQIADTHTISSGLDYPGIGPEHAFLNSINRVSYVAICDDEAIEAFKQCCLLEGIIPALESAHALAYASKLATQMNHNQIIIVNISGRGDKDIFTINKILNVQE